MASKNGQVPFATKGNNFSTSAASGEFIGVTTQSKAKAVATSKLVPLREQRAEAQAHHQLDLVRGTEACCYGTHEGI